MATLLTSKEYKKLEEILKVVNKNYVTVSDDDIDEVNPIFINVVSDNLLIKLEIKQLW